jgi:hypothetical protein
MGSHGGGTLHVTGSDAHPIIRAFWRLAESATAARESLPPPARSSSITSVSDASPSLADFVTYVQTHLTGDEKGESADFLDRLFRALGHDGIKEAGATRETRVAKKGGAKGKNYADLLWPERVLIEMKSRGKKLERQYDQIFDYWTHIVPHRPPFVILCNFDEFWTD